MYVSSVFTESCDFVSKVALLDLGSTQLAPQFLDGQLNHMLEKTRSYLEY